MALGYFEEAFASAPKAPQILYALGTAHKESGHPVVGAAFLKAYLAAWPDAPNAAKVRRRILELEVFIDRLVKDLFKEAMAAAEELPDDEDKSEALRTVIEKMARAGDLALVRKAGLKRPSGVPEVLARLAANLAQEFHDSGVIVDAADPIKLFDLAEEISKAEADYNASLPVSDSYVQWSYFKQVCAVSVPPDPKGYKDCVQAKHREYKREEPQRRLFRQGEGLVSLAVYLKKAYLGKRAYNAWRKGNKLIRESGLFEKRRSLKCPGGWSPAICMTLTKKGGRQVFVFMDSKGVIRFPRNSSDRFSKFQTAPRDGSSWLEIVRTGRAVLPWRFRLNDPAFRNLVDLIERTKREPLRNAPANFAELAGKLARARRFLKVNPG
ncbi:MAG: hypothetical protein ACE5JS_02570 [Nitrospinota bacterium]